MSVTKDSKTGKWMSQLRVTDWTGNVIHKKKRGFDTKREALEWEHEFIMQASGSIGMTFADFIKLYFEDMEKRLKPSTVANKRWLIDLKITPYFEKKALNEIKPTDIRRWQNKLKSYRDEKGVPYSETYLKSINNQLTAVFNYAVKYYGLKENPCHKAGSMGKKNAEEMQFWTKDEFSLFIDSKYFDNKPESRTVFMTLYYTGMREGELLALSPADIDLEKKEIRINKSYQRLKKKDVITTPKTKKSNRVIQMPDFLCDEMQDYFKQLYGLESDSRIFPLSKYALKRGMAFGCKASGVKVIRIHDLRHSHVSLLINMGYSAVAIGNRVGHESVEITYRYAHLFPTVQKEMADKLNVERSN